LLLFAALSAGATAARPARADGRAHPRPIPAWVDREPSDPRAGAVKVAADDGVVWLLSDRQYRAGPKPERYTRNAFRVDTPTGIETISEIELDYDPTFEKLALGFVHILRGGRVIDALAQADWKVIQPESDMDKRIYSGELEGLLFLHDVRVGDVIDYAYTIRGENPIAAGHFVREVFLDEESGVADLRRRIVTDADHPLTVRPHGADAAPVEGDEGALHTYTWHLTDVPPTDDDDDVPSWYRSDGWVDVSDYGSWNEIARSSAALFDGAAGKSSEVNALVAKWQNELPTVEARALAATRFVQDEIRYLGVEMGPHSHQPFAVDVVLKRRFGDCKDKSLLLATMLRALGVEAAPALVNTKWLHRLDEKLPSPFAFDHVVVRATLGGQPMFIDATASLQRGPLVGRAPPSFERALVVSRDTQGLIPMGDPRPKGPTYDVDETYTLPPGGGAVQLDVVTTYREDDADEMRTKLADGSREELGKNYVNYYADTYADIQALGVPEFRDDPDANVVVATEHYVIPSFWKDGERDLFPDAINARLKTPKVTRRHMPLGLVFPDRVAQHLHVTGSGHADVPEATDDRDDGVRFRSSAHLEKDTLTLDYEYEALSDAVPVDKVPAHLALLEKIGNDWAYTVHEGSDEATSGTRSHAPTLKSLPMWEWITGGVAIVGIAAWSVGGVLLWRRRRAFRGNTTLAQGEAPTVPIVVGDANEIDAHVGRASCACRSRLARVPGFAPVPELRLGDRMVCAVPVACTACGAPRRMYFELRGPV